jgi:hypothetical protein
MLGSGWARRSTSCGFANSVGSFAAGRARAICTACEASFFRPAGEASVVCTRAVLPSALTRSAMPRVVARLTVSTSAFRTSIERFEDVRA